MAMKITLIALSVLVAIAAASHREKRVVGGAPYQPGEYPFSVSLWYMGENNFYTQNTSDRHHTCGGSLVAEDWVLTSAVCFDDNFLPGVSNLSNWFVVLGMYNQLDAEAEAQFVNISDVFYLPEYNLTESYGDIALLKLGAPANLSDPMVDIVDFSNDTDCPYVGQQCTVIGWGNQEELSFGNSSYVPNAVSVDIESLADCNYTYSNHMVQSMMGPIRVEEGTICAGVHPDGGQDACNGDAGSPLLCQCGPDGDLIVVATVTTGFGCARPGFSGIYADVGYHAAWIEETIADNSDY